MKKTLLCGLVLAFILIFSGYASALCVKVPLANLRSGPDTKHEKTWHVFKYMPFKKLAKKNSWYKVQDVDGDEHWIFSKLVTSKFNCAVVKVDKVNIRSGPGTNFGKEEFSPAIKYDSYKVLKTQGLWVKVVDEFDNIGWISRKLLWIY